MAARRRRSSVEDDGAVLTALDEESAEEKPRRRRGRSDEDDSGEGNSELAEARKNIDRPSGWGALEELQKESRSGGGDFMGKDDYWKPVSGEEEVLVKFLDDEPFLTYVDTWVNSTRKMYSSTNPNNAVAALKAKGFPVNPSTRALFNVLIYDLDSEEWVLRCFRATPAVQTALIGVATSRRGPLSKHYWEISTAGEKQTFQVNLQAIKADEVRDDWEVEPLSEDDLAEFAESAYTAEDQYLWTDEELDNVAREIVNSSV